MQPSLEIRVSARQSPLSKAQVEEVYQELLRYHPHVLFNTHWVETRGDLDKKSSLRALEKSDFFTYEIDQMLLQNACDVAIHSAKDLPDPLASGLKVAAYTKGVDPSDVLVYLGGQFPQGGLVGTSSERREENVRTLFPEARFVDIRGTIQERLDKLIRGEIDGLVVAEAALIRLNLTHFPRLQIPGPVAALQGKLAIVIRQKDHFLEELFSPLADEQNA